MRIDKVQSIHTNSQLMKIHQEYKTTAQTQKEVTRDPDLSYQRKSGPQPRKLTNLAVLGLPTPYSCRGVVTLLLREPLMED